MVSDVLLLSYLDKIRLILTGEAGQALAYLYREARLYKGARMAPLSQSTTPRSTGNISVGEESRPLQHKWNSKGFVLSRSNLLLHNSLHFQQLMKTRGESFKTPIEKKKLSSVLFILTANEHILTEFWLQTVEVAITSVGMSVQ
jgi:hypothetical protein